jgi:hypothetical protein
MIKIITATIIAPMIRPRRSARFNLSSGTIAFTVHNKLNPHQRRNAEILVAKRDRNVGDDPISCHESAAVFRIISHAFRK